jgi:hypothetical protein
METKNYNNRSNLIIEDINFSNTILKLNKCSDVIIKNCKFVNSSIYCLECKNINISNNDLFNSGPKHCIQFDKCTGGNISNNYIKEPIGESLLSDIINIYKSNGTEANPILIQNNYILGGGPHHSGGGIILGDNMGNWQIAKNNIVIDPGQYGMAIAGGSYNHITNNVIICTKKYNWSNVGLYVWGIPQRNSVVDFPHITGNRINWLNKLGIFNNFWKGKNVNNLIFRQNSLEKNLEPLIPKKPENVGKLN